eukprot:8176955-Heterocapsa_arctica.AAC.1
MLRIHFLLSAGQEGLCQDTEENHDNDDIKWLHDTKKGMLVRILALGHIYQMGKCKDLEGIMDMVVYLENKIRSKDKEQIREEEET